MKRRIVNISSEAGSISDAWRKSEYAYCMSKSALNMASRILQNYLENDNIKILAIHPGWFSSDMGTSAAPIIPDESAAKIVKLLGRSFDLKGTMYYDLDGNQMQREVVMANALNGRAKEQKFEWLLISIIWNVSDVLL